LKADLPASEELVVDRLLLFLNLVGIFKNSFIRIGLKVVDSFSLLNKSKSTLSFSGISLYFKEMKTNEMKNIKFINLKIYITSSVGMKCINIILDDNSPMANIQLKSCGMK
jgi:hypothetical protein